MYLSFSITLYKNETIGKYRKSCECQFIYKNEIIGKPVKIDEIDFSQRKGIAVRKVGIMIYGRKKVDN